MNEISYENVLMYNMCIPTYDSDKKDKVEWDDSLDANNPDNFKD